MPITKFLPSQASNCIAKNQDAKISLLSWAQAIETSLITKIYESIDEVTLWFPGSKNTEDETITIYQIIRWLKETILTLSALEAAEILKR